MAKKSKLQIRLEYTIARSLLGGLGLMPRGLALLVSGTIAKIGYHALGDLRRIGIQNLALAFPEMPDADRRRILKGTFENLGRVLGEVSQFHKATRERLSAIIDFDLDEESRELYKRNKAENRGVLITTGHFGPCGAVFLRRR